MMNGNSLIVPFDTRPIVCSICDAPLAQSAASSVIRLLSLQDYNTRVVLLGTVVIGLTAGLLGVFLLLRRRALIGDAISHATLPGVALAFLWTTSLGYEKSLPVLLTGAALSGALGGAAVLVLRHLVRIREDAALGIVLSVFFGAGVSLVTLVQKIPGGNAAGLDGFIFGKAASMTSNDVWLSIWAGLIVIVAVVLLTKELKLLCFDSALAQSQGWPVLFLDSLLIGLVVAVTMVGLQAVGLILIIALLVVPAASARFWTHNLTRMLLISSTIGAISCAIGTVLSATFANLPSGATIVMVACGLFALSFAFGTKRGVVWQIARVWEMRRTHDVQHLLRAIYEVLELHNVLPTSAEELKSTAPVALVEVCERRAWSLGRTQSLANKMSNAGLLVLDGDSVQLTPKGILRALATVRDHRLLELYLVEAAEANALEADREADYLEHGLQPEHLAELSGTLLQPGAKDPLPPSPHKIDSSKSNANDKNDDQDNDTGDGSASSR